MPITCKTVQEVASSESTRSALTLIRELNPERFDNISLDEVLSSLEGFRKAVNRASKLNEVIDDETLAEVEALVIAQAAQNICTDPNYSTANLATYITETIGFEGLTQADIAMIKEYAARLSDDEREDLEDYLGDPDKFVDYIREHGGDNPQEFAKAVIAYYILNEGGLQDYYREAIQYAYAPSSKDGAFFDFYDLYRSGLSGAHTIQSAFSHYRADTEDGVKETIETALRFLEFVKSSNEKALRAFVEKMAREKFVFVRNAARPVVRDGRIGMEEKPAWMQAK